ncbi:MAG TPA: hypothetical protein VEZ90_07720, partial [Blastocatellia bacterium]|nr:hypothetical protein [Blastocatellia bacterium]
MSKLQYYSFSPSRDSTGPFRLVPRELTPVDVFDLIAWSDSRFLSGSGGPDLSDDNKTIPDLAVTGESS